MHETSSSKAYLAKNKPTLQITTPKCMLSYFLVSAHKKCTNAPSVMKKSQSMNPLKEPTTKTSSADPMSTCKPCENRTSEQFLTQMH